MEENLYFNYKFIFNDNSIEMFNIELDKDTLNFKKNIRKAHAKWTQLENHQCSNCKLKVPEHLFCPVALNLNEIFLPFKDKFSYDEVLVRVETNDRTYEHNTTMQRGLSSLIGILMVSSGCSVMDILKPMVRFHLPFATVEETIFRSATSYLLGQYFRHKKNKSVDWYMKDLSKAYEGIQLVNIGMANRIRSVSGKDANVNAVVVLDIFAKELPFTILSGLDKLAYLYDVFIETDKF